VWLCALQIWPGFLTPWATSEQVPYIDGNISSLDQMVLRRNWISSPVAEVMNRFAEGCSHPPKSRIFHIVFFFFLDFNKISLFFYQCTMSLSTRLWVNDKPTIMGQPHKTLLFIGYFHIVIIMVR
jgi:hypothetical protein